MLAHRRYRDQVSPLLSMIEVIEGARCLWSFDSIAHSALCSQMHDKIELHDRALQQADGHACVLLSEVSSELPVPWVVDIRVSLVCALVLCRCSSALSIWCVQLYISQYSATHAWERNL
jgi:hypothetical protein